MVVRAPPARGRWKAAVNPGPGGAQGRNGIPEGSANRAWRKDWETVGRKDRVLASPPLLPGSPNVAGDQPPGPPAPTAEQGRAVLRRGQE